MRLGTQSLIAGVFLMASSATLGAPVDLNNASPDELWALPLPPDVLEEIIDRLAQQGAFRSFYDLRQVEGLTQAHLDALRQAVVILPPSGRSADMERVDAIYDKIATLGASEGANEALIDATADQLRVPLELGRATVDELQSLPGVSPIDAAAIVRHVGSGKKVSSRRELRRVPGLSNYGWRSVRDFVRYDSRDGLPFGGDFQTRLTRPILDSDAVELFHEDYYDADDRLPANQQAVRDAYTLLGLDEAPPALTNKMRLRWGSAYDLGLITHRRTFEDDLGSTLKGYAGLHKKEFGPLEIERLVVGNFSLALGQGLILENTDFFRPRKSGVLFDKRQQGILGDISRTDQHAFRGAAAELRWNKLRVIGFASNDDRDAIVDDAGQVRTLITLAPRIESADFPDTMALHPDHELAPSAWIELDAVNETTWGGNIRFEFQPGTHIGITGYESLYDKFFRADWDGILQEDAYDNLTSNDVEYTLSNQLQGRYRRVLGADGQVVWRNLMAQGEFARQAAGGDAYILNAFGQWSSLNLFLSYRNYDVDYDNPYNRGFSEKERYDGTIFEDPFRLTNPLMSQVFIGSAQPSPETGFYGSTRYQIARSLVGTVDYSTWRRNSDASTFKRLVPRINYSPSWPIRIQWRHKWQTRNEESYGATTQISQTIEDRFRLRFLLSDRNSLELLYHLGHTRWPGRGRLAGVVDAGPVFRDPDPGETDPESGDQVGGSPLQGSVTEPTTALSAAVTHKLNPQIKLRGGVTAFSGFFWNWEDTEFLIADGQGTRIWLSVWDRLSDHLSLYLKASWQRSNPTNYRDARLYNGEYEYSSLPNDAPLEMVESTNFRLQMDYTW